MSTEGIEAVFVETHNWGKTASFFRALGYTLDFETDHSSGQLANGHGPTVFVAEIPRDQVPTLQLVLRVIDEQDVPVDDPVKVVTPFEDTHFGTRTMTVKDPDGRRWTLQAPGRGTSHA